ncbi:hypothetical protein TgHK011_000605 [Trichoderma gracile]|nr:hypothetical protein TgHK011_000605 [Trichoderma gracile]
MLVLLDCREPPWPAFGTASSFEAIDAIRNMGTLKRTRSGLGEGAVYSRYRYALVLVDSSSTTTTKALAPDSRHESAKCFCFPLRRVAFILIHELFGEGRLLGSFNHQTGRPRSDPPELLEQTDSFKTRLAEDELSRAAPHGPHRLQSNTRTKSKN